ncbi:expressed unknown protein [Seminavis robusta]|uniref:Uncharacterized protein n=1 Tax=Seminavis robusta TaxID=568900 RepID=A0A9N8DDF1_9STRA|nr:expressed unknown protein [Seminavis robusta]|eukprot:Sro39_g024000.1 n/a (672) ;mRNA; f:31232-33247
MASRSTALEILDDVGTQIDQERAKCLKLEAQIEQLLREQKQEKQMQQRQKERLMDDSSSRSHSSRRSAASKTAGTVTSTTATATPTISPREFMALQAQVDGTKDIVEALTCERPAMAAAIRRGGDDKILPLELVRLLEVLPWHPYVQERINVHDAIYEWQCYDYENQQWRGDLVSFPDFFLALPTGQQHQQQQSCHSDDDGEEQEAESEKDYDDTTIKNESQSDDDDLNTSSTSITSISSTHSSEKALVSDSSQRSQQSRRRNSNKAPGIDFWANLLLNSHHHHHHRNDSFNVRPRQERQVVLTNSTLTQRYALRATEGYPLPKPNTSGTWKWVGQWKIDKQHINAQGGEDMDASATSDGLRCDADGWTYAREASHFVLWNAHKLWGRQDDASNCTCRSKPQTFAPDHCGPHCRYNDELQQQHGPLLRRRKWIRQRVLVDFPYASKSTLEYLRIHAENASLSLATYELAGRLRETTTTYQHVKHHWDMCHKTNQVRLQHYQMKWEHHEELIKKLRYGKFKRKIFELSCSQDDILPIIANPAMFWQLQQALRQSGAITNAMLQQGIHFYIQDHVRRQQASQRALVVPRQPQTDKQTQSKLGTNAGSSSLSSSKQRHHKNGKKEKKRKSKRASKSLVRPSDNNNCYVGANETMNYYCKVLKPHTVLCRPTGSR